MKVSIPEHKEHEAARKGLLLGLWADGDEFFGGTVEEVFAKTPSGQKPIYPLLWKEQRSNQHELDIGNSRRDRSPPNCSRP